MVSILGEAIFIQKIIPKYNLKTLREYKYFDCCLRNKTPIVETYTGIESYPIILLDLSSRNFDINT